MADILRQPIQGIARASRGGMSVTPIGDKMTETTTQEATTTHAPRRMTVQEYYEYVASMPNGHVILPPMPNIILTDLDSYKEAEE